MAHIVLVTGGSRSGKSHYAILRAQEQTGPRVFVATCLHIDPEMNERIQRHQEERSRSDWLTIEEPLEIAAALNQTRRANVRIVDCLTLWVNNIMYAAEQSQAPVTEDAVQHKCLELLEVCSNLKGMVLLVTNEIGLGIVPENHSSRLFRDLVGRCNQTLAQQADEVTLMVSSLPLHLKRGKSEWA